MATLQNLRNRGPLLVASVGIALIAFVLLEFFKPTQGSNAEEFSVGTLNEERISAQEFYQIKSMYESIASQNKNAKSIISEFATTDAWETIRDLKIAEKQAELLGIKVTQLDIDMWLSSLNAQFIDNILMNINEEKNAYLLKYGANAFNYLPATFCAADPETRTVTIAMDSINKYRSIAETGIAASQDEADLCNISRLIDIKMTIFAINVKQEAILNNASIVNHAVAKKNFEKNNSTRKLEYVLYPYSNVSNEAVTVTDAEVAEYYNANKDFIFKNPYDTREGYMIEIDLKPSDNDKLAVREEMNEYVQMLQEDSVNYYDLSLMSQSEFRNDEYYWTLDAVEYNFENNTPFNHFPENVKNIVKNTEIGQVTGPVFEYSDMTDNVFKNIDKLNIAKEYTISFALINSESADSVSIVTDSILTALKNNKTNFKELANNYFAFDSLKFNANEFAIFKAQFDYYGFKISPDFQKDIYTSNKGEFKTFEYTPNAKVVYQVIDKKDEDVAYKTFGIRRTIMVSQETRDLAYDNLSKFITSCDSIDMFANHPNARTFVVTDNNITLNSISGTRDILAWIMNDNVTAGKISNIFDNQNSKLIAVGITEVLPKGYFPLESAGIADYIKNVLRQEKKADVITAELNGKNFDEIKNIANVVIDTVPFIEYASTATPRAQFIEPAINKVAANLEINATSKPIKGNEGIFVVKVLEKKDKENSVFNLKHETTENAKLYNRAAILNEALYEVYDIDNKVNSIN